MSTLEDDQPQGVITRSPRWGWQVNVRCGMSAYNSPWWRPTFAMAQRKARREVARWERISERASREWLIP